MTMPTFPGVFIREVSSGVRTITGVSTSIALFIGRAMSGTLNEPQRILGFTDYARIFTTDTSFGEMTDQVRQFFLNGGQQAYVVRIAKDAQTATVTLPKVDGTAAITLKATSAGSMGTALRASVDYNTPDPERTFNLRLFRETLNASGNPVISDEEVHPELSMDGTSPRYVVNVLKQQSRLAEVDTTGFSPAAAFNGASISNVGFADNTAVGQALLDATATAGFGTFRIQSAPGTIDTFTFSNQDLQNAGTVAAAFTGPFTTALTNAGFTVTRESTSGFLIIQGAGVGPNFKDVRVLPGTTADIAGALGLGLSNGGLEIGPFADQRPAPSNYVSRISNTSPDAARILNFANRQKDDLTQASMGPAGLGEFADVPITLLGGPTDTIAVVAGGTNKRLDAVRSALTQIASAINAQVTNWRAERHGLRLALIPRFGTSSQAGAGAQFEFDDSAAGQYLGTADGQIFESLGGADDVLPRTRADAFAVPNPMQPADGFAPLPEHYEAALQVVEESVDLVNIIVLPKDVGETDDTRAGILTATSAWAQKNRAFLLVDPPAGIGSVDAMAAGIEDLRDGMQKDHAAVYFPRVEIIAATGGRKTVDPSGSIAGLMARIDASRGVWKAPAGLEAGIRGAVDVDVPMSDEQNGILNPVAVNCIRDYPEGIISWGARTMDGFDNSGNDDYKYVPVRRFALFIEESLVRGLRFAVFEPNGPALWQQIRLAAGAFLNGLFRQGAFAGDKARDAFFVKVDQETTTPTDINLGIVNVVVGFAPLKPAEFVIITIQQQTAQVQV